MQRCGLILAGIVLASSAAALAVSASSLTPPAPRAGAVTQQSAVVGLRGLYVVTKVPPASKATGDAVTAALNVPGVSGVVLVLGWDVIEPAMGQYDWTDFDQWAAMAASAGKKIELSITTGYVGSNHTPAWLFQPAPGGGGAKPLIFSFTRKPADTTCLTETITARRFCTSRAVPGGFRSERLSADLTTPAIEPPARYVVLCEERTPKWMS